MPARRFVRALPSWGPAFLLIWAAAGLPVPGYALVHQVSDFRQDSSASAADRYRLDPGWGDSLLLLPESFRYTTVKTQRLSDGSVANGVAGAAPVVANIGLYRFKVAYLAWTQPHDTANGPTPKDSPPQANIVTRIVDLSPDTAVVQGPAQIIAANEIPSSPKFTYPQSIPPAPAYLSFSADGDKFAAYWGSGTPSSPIRRATDRDNGLGTYVPSAAAATKAFGFGWMSSAMVPGSGGNRTVLAYEADYSPAKFQVRWEDIAAGTSDSLIAPCSSFPYDFAVAADSSGNALVLWRQQVAASTTYDLYGAAFDNTHAQILPATLLETGIAYTDSSKDHNYRPYAAAGMTRGHFLIAYATASAGPHGPVSVIHTRTIDLPLGAQPFLKGNAVAVSPEPDGLGSSPYSLFPDLTVSPDRVVVGWYQRPGTGTGNARRLTGSILVKTGNGFTLTGRTDIDFAGENITFSGMDSKWNWTHWFRSANVALDGKGNVVAAYDSGTFAKVALVRNTPIYYDSAAFASKSLKVENPAIPSFTFNPASDSVAFLPFRPVTNDTVKTLIRLALSPNNVFTGAVYQAVPSPLKSAAGFFRYSVDLLTTKTGLAGTTNLTTPKLRSLEIEYNVKPATPAVDSLKRGSAPMAAFNPAAANPLLPRKDSLVLVCNGFDADDDGMEFRLSLGGVLLKAVAGTRTAPGRFRAILALMPPDTALNPLPLTLTTVDAGGWASRPVILSFAYKNITPSQTLTVYRNRGRDSASVYVPSGGGTDTIFPVDGGLIAIQAGDSLAVKVRYADGNDGILNAAWLRNSVPLGNRTVAVDDSTSFRFSPDDLAPAIDTLVASAGDQDTTVTLRIPVRPNHTPVVDSVFHAAYTGGDGVSRTGPFDVLRDLAADTGLTLPNGLPTVIRGGFSDADLATGDSLSVSWKVWKQPDGCARENPACYQAVDSAVGPALTRVFDLREQFLTVRVTDASGAFRQRRVWLEYPVLDTTGSGAAGYAMAIHSLTSAIDFIIDSDRHDTTIRAEILSKGTADLRILSVATRADDRKWLDLRLEWLGGMPPRPDSARFSGPTNVNALGAGQAISLPAGAGLTFVFRFFSDSLRGDSVLADTLWVATNDFANPVLKIPFHLVHRDLPLARLEIPGSMPARGGGGFNAAGLPALVPARSSLAVIFTETVRVTDPTGMIRVYSYLDSVKNGSGFSAIPGSYDYRRKGTGLRKVSASSADSLADTLLFTPRYEKASDSLKVIPEPGFFIYGDFLRIALSNGITDKAGNALDLRLDRKFLAPGSFDTVFQARVDTSRLMVLSTQPPAGSNGFNTDGAIKIRFNRKLSKSPPMGRDSLTLLDLNALKHADNRGVRVTSVFRTGKTYDFQFLSLADNDSSLVFRTRPLLPALDTVTVILSGGILDTSGLSLDGNGDKFPDWLYDQRDSVDAFTFTFMTSVADFYVFPNPFRFADSRHRDKGGITFKNLNALRGYSAASDVTLRVHTMTGDLVYNSDKASGGSRNGRKRDTSLEWDLRNDHGGGVGTGVYIYTLMKDGKSLLRKGKVALVR